MKKNDPDYIKWLLDMNDRAVERAMIVLYERQDADEQSAESTLKQNGRGFSSWDARKGTYYARWVMSGRNLTGHHLTKARIMAKKYVKQLAEVATQKMASTEAPAE